MVQQPTKQVPILSFFTGAGFLDLGFMDAGFQVVWHNEFDPSFVRGFNHGMKSLLGDAAPHIESAASIEDVDAAGIIAEAFGDEVPEVFGVIGGPPCPDFSVGGKNRGHEGDRGRLTRTYIQRVLELKPTFFLMENVPGLLRTSKHREFFHQLLDSLALEYATDYRVLNALDFGVPQDRQRVFLIGFRREWLEMHSALKPSESTGWFPWPEDERYKDAKTRFAWPTTSPFGETPEKPSGIPNELMVGTHILPPQGLAGLENAGEGFKPYSARLAEVDEGDTSRKSYKRLHRYRYSPTCAYGNNEVHLHPSEPRRITVREAMRLQTVPDGYALPNDMPLSHKFKTIGNGVPVALAAAVAKSISAMVSRKAKADAA